MYQLEKGIFLEDIDLLLPWGEAIDKLVDMTQAKVEEHGDRTIFNWGEHEILNGLKLNLITQRWDFEPFINHTKFDSIGFWAIGDKVATDSFDQITNHIIKEFGQPNIKNDQPQPERSWKWTMDGIELIANFIEQHCYKFHLTIKKQ